MIPKGRSNENRIYMVCRKMNITETMRKKLLGFQRNEITEHHIYGKLAEKVKSPENRKILKNIADDELRHYRKWRD